VKRSALAEGLRVAAGAGKKAQVDIPQPIKNSGGDSGAAGLTRATARPVAGTVLIGGHFSPQVRRALLLVQAEPENQGKNLKQLLGEAINDLCVKYGKPEPYQEDI
jgi:hypothetical protein